MSQCCAPSHMPASGNEDTDLNLVRSVLAKDDNAALVSLLEKIGPCISNIPSAVASNTLADRLRELNEVGVVQGVFTGDKLCFCVNGETMARVRSAMQLRDL